jgi:Tfp pilus assembly protein PilN
MSAHEELKTAISAISGFLPRLKTMGGTLLRVLTFSLADESLAPAKSICVAVERGLLSVAYGSRILSRITLKGCRLFPSDGKYPTPEILASSVGLALNAMGNPKAEVTLSLPKAWTVIKMAELPSAVRDNLADVVSYELDRITPFAPGEAFYDFRVVKEDGEKIALLVAAIKTDLINPYIAALADRGYNVDRVTINLSAIGALCRYADKRNDSLLVRIGEKECEGALFEGGVITASFSASFGSDDDREKLDTVLAELGPFLDGQKKGGTPPQIVVSAGERDTALVEMMKLRISRPFKILEQTDLRLDLPAKEISYEAAGGVIESLWPKSGGLNLLQKGKQTKGKTPVVLTGLLALGVLALWVLYLVAPLRIEGNRLKEIDRQIAMRKDEVKKIEALKKDIAWMESDVAAINNFKANRPMALTLIKELTVVLPKTAWLTRAKITETTVDIEGYASSATELIPKLEASSYFQKTEFASPTFRDQKLTADRFAIKMEIEGAKKAEAKKPEPEKTTGGEKPKHEKK